MSGDKYRREDADRVWAWLGSNEGTAFEIATALSVSSIRVRKAVLFIRRTAEYTDGIPVHFGNETGVYRRTAELDVAYMKGLANQARHLSARCATALVEAERAPHLRARHPEVMRALFGSATGHLRTASTGLDYYTDDLDAIDKLLGES